MKFDGEITLGRPVRELATVFDMCGLASEPAGDERLTATDGSTAIVVVRQSPETCRVQGEVTSDLAGAVTLVSQIALALEADGIAFALRVYDLNGVEVRRFSPIG